MVGMMLGAWWGGLWMWLAVGLIATGWLMWHADRRVVLLGVVAISAAWGIARSGYTTSDDVGRFVLDEPRLVQVVGVV